MAAQNKFDVSIMSVRHARTMTKNILYATMAFVILTGVVMLVINNTSDLLLNTKIFDIPTHTYNVPTVVDDDVYENDVFKVSVVSKRISDKYALITVEIENKTNETMILHNDNFRIVKYIDNARDIKMSYYPEFDNKLIIEGGKKHPTTLHYNMSVIETTKADTMWCLDCDIAKSDIIFILDNIRR